MPGLKDDLQGALEGLNKSAPEIRSSAFVSLDGLMLASALPEGTNEDAIAAMSATVLGLGERTTREFAVGSLVQIYFKGAGGYIILHDSGEEGVLVVVTDETAKLGVLFLLLKRTSEEIRQIVKYALTPRFPSRPEQPPAGSQPNVPWGV